VDFPPFLVLRKSSECLLTPALTFTRDLLQWPLAIPNDGLIDIVVQETASPSSLVSQMGRAPHGGQYWFKTVSEETSLNLRGPDPGHLFRSLSLKTLPSQQHYFKVHAYRIKTSEAGLLSIDGEDAPCDDFQVEVHKGMGAFLSPSGRFGVHFSSPAPASLTQ
jgi:sphingosine kinase